jgi:hypothetical protein
MIKGTLASLPLPKRLIPVATQLPADTHEMEFSALLFVDWR